jgi:hypothetical protein
LRDADEEHHVKENETAQKFNQIWKFFSYSYENKTYKIDWLFLFRRIFTMLTSNCFCEHSRQTLRHILLFCRDWSKSRQRMLRDDETTNMSRFLNIEKSLKISIIWLMKINLLTHFSLTKEYLD